MQLVNSTIDKVTAGKPQSFRNLTVFPLFNGNAFEADYLTVDEALGQKVARVTEVSEGGRVPELTFTNSGDKRVFLLDGEELVGAKQNRVLNLSIMAPAGRAIIIPVSCVEAGRWRHRSREFSSADRAQYAEARLRKTASVTRSMKSHGQPRSDQREVWANIGLKFAKFGFASPTAAMSDIFENNAPRIEDYVKALGPEEGQAGAMFAIDGRIIGLDLFDASDTLRKLLPKLIRSYALDAIDALISRKEGETEPGAPSEEEAGVFLRSVCKAKEESFTAVGEGRDLRLEGEELTGAALQLDNRLVHLSAFRTTHRIAPGASRQPCI